MKNCVNYKYWEVWAEEEGLCKITNNFGLDYDKACKDYKSKNLR